jgi:hypothetical protein
MRSDTGHSVCSNDERKCFRRILIHRLRTRVAFLRQPKLPRAMPGSSAL